MYSVPCLASAVFLDAHVHLRPRFDVQDFLQHAYLNFHTVSVATCRSDLFSGVLLLTEAADEQSFSSLKKSAASAKSSPDADNPGWSFVQTDESCSLIAVSGNRKLALVAGCQVFTQEKLEVLVLGTENRIRDGLPITNVLEWAKSSKLIHVLPWSPGRWLFGRGKIIERLLQSRPPCDLFVGDNGSRPWFWALPSKIKRAQGNGFRLLSGSDPLPLPGEHRRPGSFGCYAHFDLDWTQPWSSVQQNLRQANLTLHSYGRPIGALSFLVKEVGMQLTKGTRRRANYYGRSS